MFGAENKEASSPAKLISASFEAVIVATEVLFSSMVKDDVPVNYGADPSSMVIERLSLPEYGFEVESSP